MDSGDDEYVPRSMEGVNSGTMAIRRNPLRSNRNRNVRYKEVDESDHEEALASKGRSKKRRRRDD